MAPLLGGTWNRTAPLVTVPNVSIDGRETCWIAVPNKAGAKTQSGLAGWRVGELLLAGELFALWRRFADGRQKRNYLRKGG